jgi:hypothetical protein
MSESQSWPKDDGRPARIPQPPPEDLGPRSDLGRRNPAPSVPGRPVWDGQVARADQAGRDEQVVRQWPPPPASHGRQDRAPFDTSNGSVDPQVHRNGDDIFGNEGYARSRTYGKGHASAWIPADLPVIEVGQTAKVRDRATGVAVLPEPAREAAAEPKPPSARGRRTPARRVPWGLLLVLALQTCISLSLIWTNSAFGDEANYLWAGHLELSHWFGGGPTPHFNVLSGASLVYPPLGALASSIGGLAGARILSLVFMLGATALLYSIAARLFSRRAAVAAAALWAVSVSALKLGAFATYDPMATFLICLSAWLIVQASFRRRAPELAILAALAMVIGDLTAYSYAIYDVALIAFAFFQWRARLGPRRSWELQAWLFGALATLGFAIPTVMGLWSDIVAVTFTRSGSEAEVQGYVLTAQLAWEWSGLVAVLALAGAITGFAVREDKGLRAVLAVLAGSALLVPVYQLHLQTGWALDKHLSCGIWLAAMSAGYLIAKIPVPADRRGVMALAGIGALAFPVVNGWMSAYSDFETWPNATTLTAIVKPVVADAHAGGLFTGTNSNWVLDYYTSESSGTKQWGTGPQISLNAASLPPQDAWQAFYGQQLERSKFQYSVIALQFPVGVAAFGGQPSRPVLPSSSALKADLTKLTADDASLATQDALAAAVETDSHYRLVGVIDYSDNLAPGSFLIWARQ